MLSDGAAEIAITVAGNHYPSTLNHCEYGHDQLAIFYDPACRDPITTVQEYAQARHGTVNFGGSPKSEVQKALALMDIKRDVALVAPTASMLGDLIEGTDIIATMPESLKHSAYAKLACTRPPFELPGLVYDLAWHRRYEASGRHQWLRKMLLEARREVEQTIAAQTPK
jgi:DNA-binding transcriptional LysR family regulator